MTAATTGVPLCVWCRRNPVVQSWRPFCSQRCQQQDLAQWASDSYRVRGEPAGEPDPENQKPPDSEG